jgi:DNA-3-methyladenine glycosylase
MRARLLSQTFYARDTLTVARELLGKWLRHGDVTLAITEAEAYLGPSDTACHTSCGKTARNAPMFGPAGHAYVYLCYGLHQMLNVVSGVPKRVGRKREGVGEAVLIRACQPIAGLSTIQARRGGKSGPVLLTGPGKVAAALALDRSFNAHPLYRRGGLQILDGPAPKAVLTGPRIGIDYANERDREARWRFAAANTDWVTHPNKLTA